MAHRVSQTFVISRRVHSKEKPHTVVIGLLKVLVHNAAAHNVRHVIGVQSRRLRKSPALGAAGQIASVFGKEDRHRVCLEELNETIVARRLEITVSAPGIDVIAKIVDRVLARATVEVAGNLIADGLVVIGGVPDSQPAIFVGLDVGLGVASGCLDVCGSTRVVRRVADFIAGEEANDVGILGKLVHDLSITAEQCGVPGWCLTINGQAWLAKISEDVYAVVIEELHASRVIFGRINGIHSNHVGSEGCQIWHISLASIFVGKRINVGCIGRRGAGGAGLLLVGNAPQNELGAIRIEQLRSLFVFFLVCQSAAALKFVCGPPSRTFITMDGRSALRAPPARAKSESGIVNATILLPGR